MGVAGVTWGKPCPIIGPSGTQRQGSGSNDESERFFCLGNHRGKAMAATFELFHDGDASFGFKLKAPDGTLLALSGQFSDKASAVEGIRVVRECAGTGLITDLCPPVPDKAAAETMERSPGTSQHGRPGTRASW